MPFSRPLRPLLVLLLLALVVDGAATPATSASPPAAAEQSVQVVVLPPISQPGAWPASPARARGVITAELRPRLPGRPVVLEQRRHGLWKVVDRGLTDAQGRVDLLADPSVDGPTGAYRVSAAAHRGLPVLRSDPVRANAWGDPAFLDDFSGSSLGPAWQHRIQFYNPWGGRSCSKGDPSAVALGSGVLRLSVLADPARTSERCQPTDADGNPTSDSSYAWRLNGHISTQSSFDFQYGVAAARMRFQRRRGQHASFWMQPRGLLDDQPTPWGAEIDVIEWYGTERGHERMSTAVHRHVGGDPELTTVGGPIPEPDRFLQDRSDRWWRRYHVFSVEWTPEEYVFRIDGQETMRTSEGVSHHPEFLILSLLSSDYELGALGGDDHLPQRVTVDWVQVWPSGR